MKTPEEIINHEKKKKTRQKNKPIRTRRIYEPGNRHNE